VDSSLNESSVSEISTVKEKSKERGLARMETVHSSIDMIGSKSVKELVMIAQEVLSDLPLDLRQIILPPQERTQGKLLLMSSHELKSWINER
jgi:hypothetical protein